MTDDDYLFAAGEAARADADAGMYGPADPENTCASCGCEEIEHAETAPGGRDFLKVEHGDICRGCNNCDGWESVANAAERQWERQQADMANQ